MVQGPVQAARLLKSVRFGLKLTLVHCMEARVGPVRFKIDPSPLYGVEGQSGSN